MIAFWAKLNSSGQKYSQLIFRTLKLMFDNNVFASKWMTCMKTILDTCGISHVVNEPNINVSWVVNRVKQTLQDQFIQVWYRNVEGSTVCINYRIYKTHFKLEEYLVKLKNSHRVALCRFSLGNSKLPVVRGRFHIYSSGAEIL